MLEQKQEQDKIKMQYSKVVQQKKKKQVDHAKANQGSNVGEKVTYLILMK